MSTIAPNGQIRFLTQVPIDSNYENSIDFLNELEQRTYFLGLQPVHTMIGATRVRDGVISVNMVADNLLHANYLMFQNMNFSNKWFYAFITNIEYVNNNMSYVYYQIDDIQTWMFDVQLKECFVEREHTRTDGMFEHLVDEGIGTSEYVNNREEDFVKEYKSMYALLFVSSRVEETETETHVVPVEAQAWQGNLFGLGVIGEPVRNEYGVWNTSAIDDLTEKINKLVEKQAKDSIIGCVIFPMDLLHAVTQAGSQKEYAKTDEFLYFDNFTSGTRLNGYLPKNKKLYNSPYCIFEMISSDGQKTVLQPEFVESSPRPYIQIIPNASLNPSILIVPHNYAGDSVKWDKAITFDGFPQVALSIDGYSAWVASGGLDKWTTNLYTNAVGNTVGMVGSAINKNAQGVISGAITSYRDIAQSIIDINVAKTLPSEVKGSINSTPLSSTSNIKILVKQKCITADTAKSIDDYFTMFGYRVNKVKTPSRRNRPHYTYIKTKGCKVNGGAPADAIDRIQAIYDNGIRFWVNPVEVGNYTGVDNRPV